MLQRLCAQGLCKQINVILWILLLCLMKRYVDVIKCLKNYSYFIKKKKKSKRTESRLPVVVLLLLRVDVISWRLLLPGDPRQTTKTS